MSPSGILKPSYFYNKTIIYEKNMGTADRVIRLLLAAIFAYLYFGGLSKKIV